MNIKKPSQGWLITCFLVLSLGFPLFWDTAQAAPKATRNRVLIDISQQKLYLYRGKRLVKTYHVSTSRYGVGSQALSKKTPLGLHYISHKVGRGAPLYTVFSSRQATNIQKKPFPKAEGRYITSRILVLKGLEKGKNLGKGVDTFQRRIYIHGTTAEAKIGKPASHGCIRMRNKDIVDLFKRIGVGTRVRLRK